MSLERSEGWLFTGALALDLLLGDVHSLKEKRSVVRPIVAELRRRKFDVSAAEAGHLELHRRALVGVAVVAADAAPRARRARGVREAVAARPEVEVLSASTSSCSARRGRLHR